MEEFVDAITGGAVWGAGFAIAMAAVQSLGSGVRPVARNTLRGAFGIGDWIRNVTAEGRETLQDVYHEARTEVEQERAGAAAREA